MLGQKKGYLEYATYCTNKNLQGVEVNYIVTKKEMLVVIYAINKFRYYITRYSIFIHIDHATIHYLMNKPVISGWLVRWILLL